MNLLEDIFTAYYEARKHKRNTANQLHFEMNLEENLIRLYRDIRSRTYKVGRSICFMVDKPVQREVFAADFRDRIVHHLIVGYINHFIERHLIHDCYSCRKGKGTHFGIKRLEHHIRSCSLNYTRECYVLKLDLKGYFMGIEREKMYNDIFNLLAKHMDEIVEDDGKICFWRDTEQYDVVHYLLPIVLLHDPTKDCYIKGARSDWDGLPNGKSLFDTPTGRGLPIGNLTSQLFSNVYMNDFDHFVKRDLKMKHYGRYVDDFFFVHEDKKVLLKTLRTVKDWLWKNSGIVVHPNKVYLQSYTKGVVFLGAVLKPHRTYVKNQTVTNFRKMLHACDERLKRGENSDTDLKDIASSVNSYLGVFKHHKTYNIKKKVFFSRPLELFKYGYLTNDLNKFVLKKSVREQKLNFDLDMDFEL